MEEYIFVCVGTDKLVEDSFGPRVGDLLKINFIRCPNIKVLGTMKTPIHFLNAPIFLDYLDSKKSKVILIDSALGKREEIGNTYMNLGGAEIGKAFGKSFYFPANWNIKTVVGINKDINSKHESEKNLQRIKKLAQKVAMQVTSIANEL